MYILNDLLLRNLLPSMCIHQVVDNILFQNYQKQQKCVLCFCIYHVSNNIGFQMNYGVQKLYYS